MYYVHWLAGSGSRTFETGGSGNRGPDTSPHTTYWNVRSATGLHKGMEDDIGPYINFIGTQRAWYCPGAKARTWSCSQSLRSVSIVPTHLKFVHPRAPSSTSCLLQLN
jgi:hypothetical protein